MWEQLKKGQVVCRPVFIVVLILNRQLHEWCKLGFRNLGSYCFSLGEKREPVD